MQVSSGRASKPDRAGSKVTRRGQTPVIPDDPVKYAGGPNNLLKNLLKVCFQCLVDFEKCLRIFTKMVHAGKFQDISLTHFLMLFLFQFHDS